MSESPLLEIYQGCPLCGADSRRLGAADCTGHPLWHAPLPGTLEWMACEACGHVHTRGFWTAAGLAEVFRNLNETQVLRASDNIDAIRATWAPVVERAVGLLGGYRQAMGAPEPPAWVDVGCGNGGLLMAAGDFGFSAMGVDARSETAEQLRALGFNAVSGNFVDVPLAKRFHIDVLSMMDVLEHLPYPKQALEKAARIVRPGGVLVVSLPDLTCSSWRLMDVGKGNPYWIELEHHHNFSRPELVRLLREAGFETAGFAIPSRYRAQMELYAIRAS